MQCHTLIAGVGNIFLGDDGFGVEVARRISQMALPDGVRSADFGIRGIHLAYEILDGKYPTVILADAVARGGTPGDLYVIEPDLAAGDGINGQAADAHSMSPDAVIAMLRMLGAGPQRFLVVGCEPQTTDEEIGLSPAVTGAVDRAIERIFTLISPGGGKADA